MEGIRTTIGVGARELAREGVGSPYIVSRNICALMTCASEESEAATVAWREAVVEGSRILVEMERKRTSRASWVKPRVEREPRMVCVCCYQRISLQSIIYHKYLPRPSNS